MTKHTNAEYELKRMAEVVAEVVSGVKEAIPEQTDFDIARKLIIEIEKEMFS